MVLWVGGNEGKCTGFMEQREGRTENGYREKRRINRNRKAEKQGEKHRIRENSEREGGW